MNHPERILKTRSRSRSNSMETSSVTSKKPRITQSDATSNLPTKDDSHSSKSETCETTPLTLTRDFFDVPCVDLARKLLGQKLVCLIGSQRLSGIIVETEAYLGSDDKAAHSYQGKKTERNKAMFMDPGTSYVYNIYGMYCCINISSKGEGAAVLIRALEAEEGKDVMRQSRLQNKSKKNIKDMDLTNGPSKLCQAFSISKDKYNQIDLTSSALIWLEKGKTIDSSDIITTSRINIGYAEDWTDKPLRFYILGNKYVSVKDKKAEMSICNDSRKRLSTGEKIDS